MHCLAASGRAARHVSSEFIRDDRAYRVARPIDWATGAALMVARPVWDAVGQWDEQFFLYSEETDFFRRVRDRRLLGVVRAGCGGGAPRQGERHLTTAGRADDGQ